jgi:(S)-ureidoglycine aminohydrolase
MHQLGQTRSALRPDHLLQTPDTFVRTAWPGLRRGVVIVHVSPAAGARFTEYTAELEERGSLAPTGEQRFVFVLDGQAEIDGVCLTPGGYVYLPPGHATSVSARTPARAVIIEKPWSWPSIPPPAFFTGHESNIAATPFAGDDALMVCSLLPDDPSFDFAVNTMTYLPGAALPMVEVHVMEHGLLMLEGGGIYRLGDGWYQAIAGDFIWMAPFCPQWFGALGKTPAKYLIYKNWQRGLLE